MKDLRGGSAIVTGASRGIGPFVARALAAEGMHLVLVARSASELEQVAEEMRATGVRAIAVLADITDPAQRQAVVDAALSEFGSIDVLVNNAGLEIVRRFTEISAEDIDRILQVNLVGAVHLTHTVLPHMLTRRRGHIVNMSSMAGKAVRPFATPYTTTKYGLVGLTAGLRVELRGTGVSASVVCPSFVSDVGMHAQQEQDTGFKAPRMAGMVSPEAVAKATLRAIRNDQPEALVFGMPVRPMLALYALSPRFGEWYLRRMGLVDRVKRAVGAERAS
jgi:short-subunit dehydrogenase